MANPKTPALKNKQRKILDAIFNEANGDAVRIKEMILQHGAVLKLDLNMTLRLAKELAPFQSAKKSSIEVKNDNVVGYNIIMNTLSEEKVQLIENTAELVDKPLE